MTDQERRKGGGSKLSRSETVTVRLDPKLRYLAELAARKQRRTLSSFIEWSIEDTLSRVFISENAPYAKSIADEASLLWDVDEADRFAKLALAHPDLLTHDEQILWKLIRENGYLWRGDYDRDDEWSWRINEGSLLFDRVREYWEVFKAVSIGDLEKDALPTWIKKKEIDDNDIPF